MTSGSHTGPRVLLPGDPLGSRFVVKMAAGGGAFGDVYRCEDRLAARDAAVKVLRFDGQGYQALWRREMAILRIFEAPGVVSLIDEGRVDGMDFLAMPFVDGAPFPGAVRPLAWGDIRGPVESLLTALHYVHAIGIVHRDLKPSNVLVDSEGRSHVLDFGIAWTSGATADQVYGLGTPAYTAPEQARGGIGGPPADLYAVGVMIWEALTGGWPFPARTVKSLLGMKAVMDAPSLSTAWPDGDPDVIAAVDALLALHAKDRPGTALEARALFPNAAGSTDEWDAWVADRGSPRRARDLEDLFVGEERELRQRSRRARALWADAGGAEGVPATVRRWVEAGLAWWDGCRLTVTERNLARLGRLMAPSFAARTATTRLCMPPVELEELASTLPVLLSAESAPTAPSGDSVALDSLVSQANVFEDAGEIDSAVAALESALLVVRGTRHEETILRRMAFMTADAAHPSGIEVALYRLSTSNAHVAHREDLLSMLRNLLLFCDGRHRELAAGRPLDGLVDPEARALVARVLGAAMLTEATPDSASRLLAEWEQQAGEAVSGRDRDVVLSNFLYKQGDYRGAASVCLRAAQGRTGRAQWRLLLSSVGRAADAGAPELIAAAVTALNHRRFGDGAGVQADRVAARMVLTSALGANGNVDACQIEAVLENMDYVLRMGFALRCQMAAARRGRYDLLRGFLGGGRFRGLYAKSDQFSLLEDSLHCFVGLLDAEAAADVSQRIERTQYHRTQVQSLALIAGSLTPTRRLELADTWARAIAACESDGGGRYELLSCSECVWLWGRAHASHNTRSET